MRVGILGCSDIARRKFIPALGKTAAAVLSAVGSREPAAARALLSGVSCPVCSYDELLSADLDLVYLSLPNHLHEEWSIRALKAGKHVICEKPVGLDLRSVQRMAAEAERRGLLLYENLGYLHHPQHRLARELVSSGRIGSIRLFRSAFGIPLPRRGDFRLDPQRGGGSFLDQARYPLSAALYHLRGQMGEYRGFCLEADGTDLALAGSAMTGAGELFSFSIGFGQQYECFYEIIGERGALRIDRAFTPPAGLANRIRVTIGEHDESFTAPAADQFQLMIEHVCELITGGGDFQEEHRHAVRLAEEADKMWRGCR